MNMNINMELTTWNLDQNETRKDLKRTTRINKINKEPRNKEEAHTKELKL